MSLVLPFLVGFVAAMAATMWILWCIQIMSDSQRKFLLGVVLGGAMCALGGGINLIGALLGIMLAMTGFEIYANFAFGGDS
jgi:fructose-specific phosphotransferase system IIC component